MSRFEQYMEKVYNEMGEYSRGHDERLNTFEKVKEAYLARGKEKSAGKTAIKIVKTDDGYGIKYHNTVVVEMRSDNSYIFDSGGWMSNTTKARFAQYSPFYFSQKKGDWFVKTPKGEFPFEDGMRISEEGEVLNEKK